MSTPTRVLVFIYGTLKRGATNHRLLASQEFVGTARTVAGFRLYVVADYPGLVKDPTDQRGVAGELWSVDAPTLAQLDEFEGLPQKLYRRDTVPLAPPMDQVNPETYFYMRTIRGRRPLIDGQWPVQRE